MLVGRAAQVEELPDLLQNALLVRRPAYPGSTGIDAVALADHPERWPVGRFVGIGPENVGNVLVCHLVFQDLDNDRPRLGFEERTREADDPLIRVPVGKKVFHCDDPDGRGHEERATEDAVVHRDPLVREPSFHAIHTIKMLHGRPRSSLALASTCLPAVFLGLLEPRVRDEVELVVDQDVGLLLVEDSDNETRRVLLE